MKPWFYALAKAFVRIVLTVVGRISAIGAANVPRSGPVILACNHVAYLDPPAVGSVAPRPVTYMAKKELFEIAFLGLFIRPLGAFPVDRTRGDTAAMKAALGILATGACLGIFPEGTRNKDGTGKAQLGVALLASISGAPVVPTYITGTAHAKRFEKITVVFGEPMRFELGRKATRDDLAKWTDELMGRVYALRERI
ncbi:MAG: lysophospholipid acyltransferase family protein [Vulcanimicrobiaceae bacterium]